MCCRTCGTRIPDSATVLRAPHEQHALHEAPDLILVLAVAAEIARDEEIRELFLLQIREDALVGVLVTVGNLALEAAPYRAALDVELRVRGDARVRAPAVRAAPLDGRVEVRRL